METEKAGAVGAPARHKRPPKMVRNRRGARVRLNGRDYYCGPWGSKEARKRYAELIAAWVTNDGKLPMELEAADPAAATVDEVVALYDAHELPTRPASTRETIKLALRPLHLKFGAKRASEFTALDLASLRADLVKAGRLTRGSINIRIAAIRAMFTWAGAMGRIEERVAFRLTAVKSLRRGQVAKEGRVVQPIEWEIVEATIRHASEPVRGLVLLQWHTGARPGEACALTADAIDRTGKVWIYTPARHKTAHLGKRRRIFLNAEAQAVVRPFLLRKPADAPLFSPRDAIGEHIAALASRRRTKRQPSQVARARRRAAHPKLEVADAYDVRAYRRALARAVDAANAEVRRDSLRRRILADVADPGARGKVEDAIGRLPMFVRRPARDRLVRRLAAALKAGEEQAAALGAIVDAELTAAGTYEHWHPHRLRHAFAQRAERECGDLEMVRAALGHADCRMAMRYAHPDDDRKARALVERLA